MYVILVDFQKEMAWKVTLRLTSHRLWWDQKFLIFRNNLKCLMFLQDVVFNNPHCSAWFNKRIPKVLGLYHIYRPQTSLGQGNVFAGVCLSTGGLTSQHVSQVTWPRGLHPKGSASGRGLHPWGLPTHCRVCLWWVGQTAQDPRYMGYYGIRSTSRQYASYWNAFLFVVSLHSWKCSAHITIIIFRINF